MTEPADIYPAVAPSRRRPRLSAAQRRELILNAARRAFTETGDMSGTTIKTIAQLSGISEGVIYRHFESKEHLFAEAIVVPLERAINDLVATAASLDTSEPMSSERKQQTVADLYDHLASALQEILPLLGLVLFGDPTVAGDFYREHFATATDRLAAAWRQVQERRYGMTLDSADTAARAVMGIALGLALEARYRPDFDRDRIVSAIATASMTGFFPTLASER